jgi:cation:H+ antiporter
MLPIVILLITGLAILIKGADFFIDGAIIISKKLHVSPLLIGITVVAFGTSAPELAVNIVSALEPGASDIGLGNIIGSNIANIGLILGVAAILTPLAVKRIITTREIPFMLLSALVFLALVADNFLTGASINELSGSDGVVLLLFFLIFLYYLSGTALGERSESLEKEFKRGYRAKPKEGKTMNQGIVLTIIGLAAVVIGAKLTVDNAVDLALAIGLSEILIGLTLVAIGTSLPELATSLVAAFKSEPDIAVGNIVGSNIMNTFLILGVNAVISPISFRAAWFADTLIMLGFGVLLFIMSLTSGVIRRKEGIVLLASYAAYIIYIGFRG